MLQCGAFHELHSDERAPAIFGDFVDGANVRVIQGRCSFSLTLETRQSLLVLGYVVWKEFESDEAIEFDVLRFVHHTHPTATQLLYDLVVRDGLTNHVWEDCIGDGC